MGVAGRYKAIKPIPYLYQVACEDLHSTSASLLHVQDLHDLIEDRPSPQWKTEYSVVHELNMNAAKLNENLD